MSVIDTLALVIPLITGPVQVDGRLAEPQYARALHLHSFHALEPGRGDQVPFEVFLWHDGHRLFAGFRCPEPYGIRAENLRRDRAHWDMDNFVEILVLRPGRQNGYAFAVNALGTVSDMRIYQRTQWNDDWDFNWKAAVQRSGDTLWTAEMALPLAELGFRDTVYLQILRSLSLASDAGLWGVLQLVHTDKSHVGDASYSRPFVLEGGMQPVRRWPFRVATLPTFTLVQSSQDLTGRYEHLGSRDLWYRASLDLSLEAEHWNLAATVLPDYAQVEADAAYLNLTQSALYLREKRPFFYEGFELFGTLLNALYTRALENPRWAVRSQVERGGTRGQAWLLEEHTQGRFGGLALGRSWQQVHLQGFGLAHGGRALVDLYGRYIHPSGARVSMEGLALSDSGWALAASGGYSQNMGVYVGGSAKVWGPGLSFPTLWTPYGPDLAEVQFWAGHNLVYSRPWFSMIHFGGYGAQRWRWTSKEFFNRSVGAYLSGMIHDPLLVSLGANRFQASGMGEYRFVNLGVRLGLQESRSVGVELSFGEYFGRRALKPSLGAGYQWQNLKVRGAVEALITRDPEAGTADTSAYANLQGEYRSPWGLFVRVFLQRTWNQPAFPRDEAQVILGYEPGGRSRLYLVFHPVRQAVGEPLETAAFFKVGYEFRF